MTIKARTRKIQTCHNDSGDGPSIRGGQEEEPVTPETACYYCGKGPDSAGHVYEDCEVVKEAREQWGLKLGCKLRDGWDVTLLAFAPVDNPAVAPGIVNFNLTGPCGRRDRITSPRWDTLRTRQSVFDGFFSGQERGCQ